MKLFRQIRSYALVTMMFAMGAGTSYAEETPVETEGGVPIAAILIEPGHYVTSGQNYLNNVVVKSWMNKTIIEGNIYYAGHPFKFTTEVKAVLNTPNAFTADGNFTQAWSNGAVCTIPMKLEIQRENNQLFFRSYTPASVAAQAPSGQECRRYNNYVWTFFDKPYVLSHME